MRTIMAIIIGLSTYGAYASPVKSSISARETSFEVPKQGLLAKDYIQDGLIAMWDAIENIGYGHHSDKATTWVDLTGNGHDWLDINPVGWVNKNARTANNNGALPMLVPLTNNTDISTISICCSHLQPTRNDTLIIRLTAKRKILPYNRSGGARFICTQSPSYSPAISYPFDINSFTIEFEVDKYSGYPRNLGWFGDTLCNSYLLEWVNGDALTLGSTKYMPGYFYNIRIYNRFLSQEEISYNYAIDKKRFGI